MRKRLLLLIATLLQLPVAGVRDGETKKSTDVKPLLDCLGIDSQKALGPMQVSSKEIDSGKVNFDGKTYEINLTGRKLAQVYEDMLRRLGLIKPSVKPLVPLDMLFNPDGKDCSSDILNGVAREVQPESSFPSIRFLEEKGFMSREVASNVNSHFVQQYLPAIVRAMIQGYPVPLLLRYGSLYIGRTENNKISHQDGQIDLRSLTFKGLMGSGPDIFATPQYPFALIHLGILEAEYYTEINKIVIEYITSDEYKKDKCRILRAISGDKDLYKAFKQNYLLLEEVVEKAGNNPERLDTAILFDESLFCNVQIKVKAQCEEGTLDLKRAVQAMRKDRSCVSISGNVSTSRSYNPISPSR